MKKLKKIVCSLLVVVMCLTSAPLQGFVGLEWPDLSALFTTKASAATEYTSGYYTYTVSDGKATITNFDDTISGAVVIPSMLGGYPVTSIGNEAFWDCSSLTSITIPDSVTSIGDDAFELCESLTSITVDSANEYYSSDGYGVLFNKDKTTLIRYPIGNSRSSYSIPDSVTSIGRSAFFDCTSLTSITIPDSVTSIGEVAFIGCESLTSITVESANEYYSSDEHGALFNKDKTTLIQYPIGNSRSSYSIPDSVTSIGDYAFSWCTSLTSIAIPDSVTSIGDGAFVDCSSLTSITIPDSVTSIGDATFSLCISLTSITIPDSVTSIGRSAFESCTSLTSITIPDSVTSIGDCAFADCESLTSITIPDSVTSIGDWAFRYCDKLADVYYTGSENQWKAIGIGEYNDLLLNATIHFNYCAHANKLYVATKYPTCTEAGEMKMYCPDCETFFDDVQALPALGHSYGEWEEIDETYHYHSCTVCGDIEGVEHSWSEWEEIPATCTEDGEKSRTCSVCESTDIEVLSATDHAYGEWSELLPATCQERGVNARVCLNCGTMDREIIPVQDHKDDDGDDYCDWCGSFVGEVPDFPDIDDCSCNCHKGGLAGFFFRLINFFQKLFGQNKVCACGASH